MPQVLASKNLQLPGRSAEPVVTDSMRRPLIVGSLIIFVFFGLLGGWSVSAPLRGAVVATTALVKVQGNRKSVQHLEGGIVKELRIKEGDKVAAGDVLIVLDDGQARAEYEVLTQDLIVLRATEERLRAELAHRPQMTFPEDLKSYGDERYVKEVWDA